MLLPTPKQVYLSMATQEARSRSGHQVDKQYLSANLKGAHLKNNPVEVQKYFEDSVNQDSILRQRTINRWNKVVGGRGLG